MHQFYKDSCYIVTDVCNSDCVIWSCVPELLNNSQLYFIYFLIGMLMAKLCLDEQNSTQHSAAGIGPQAKILVPVDFIGNLKSILIVLFSVTANPSPR